MLAGMNPMASGVDKYGNKACIFVRVHGKRATIFAGYYDNTEEETPLNKLAVSQRIIAAAAIPTLIESAYAEESKLPQKVDDLVLRIRSAIDS